MDPPRLRSESGTIEALLLRSAPNLEPPPSAEGELWRRLEVLGTVGAAAVASGVAVHAAASAGPKIVGKAAANAIWLSLIKWGIVVSVGVLGAGAATRFVVHRKATGSDVIARSATTSHATEASKASAPSAPIATPPAPIEASPAPIATNESSEPPAIAAPHAHPSSSRAHVESSADARSALQAESLLLGAARTKLGGGDYQGALDDVARLRAQFPRGKLVQEREVVALDSLAALGNRTALQARARAFLSRFPSSPYAEHVRSIAVP